VKAALLALALAVAVVAGLLVLRRGESYAPGAAGETREGTVTVNRRLPADAVLSIKPGTAAMPATPAAAAPPARLSPLLQDYLAGKSWKALHDRLRESPARTAEESYLLAEILDRCARVADRKAPSWPRPGSREEERKRFLATVSDKDPNAAQRIAAHEKVSTPRCEGFDDVTATEAEIRALLQGAGADPKARARLVEKEIAATLPPDGRPLMSADGTSSLPSISDAQIEALKQAVQSGDPVALAIAGRVFSSTMQNLVMRAGPGEQPVDPRAFYDAWSLAACDLGQPCGAESGRVLHSCATQGNCGARDLREHLFYFDHSPQQSQRLADYHAHILQAARTGDWSYFTFHRGAPPRNWVSIYLAR
jgi:hypothetical protein